MSDGRIRLGATGERYLARWLANNLTINFVMAAASGSSSCLVFLVGEGTSLPPEVTNRSASAIYIDIFPPQRENIGTISSCHALTSWQASLCPRARLAGSATRTSLPFGQSPYLNSCSYTHNYSDSGCRLSLSVYKGFDLNLVGSGACRCADDPAGWQPEESTVYTRGVKRWPICNDTADQIWPTVS